MQDQRPDPARARIDAALADETLPAGVVGGPRSVEALELLSEFYAAFGGGGTADEAARARAREGLPSSALGVRRHVRDRLAVLPTLRELVQALRAGADRRELVVTWNRTLRERKAVSLAPLCDVCTARVPPRRNARHSKLHRSTQWQPVEVSTVCSAKCQAARKSKLSRLRQKLRRKRVTW
jgi:hypothetical protein